LSLSSRFGDRRLRSACGLMVAMEHPSNPANDGDRCDDDGNNTAVSPESFVEMIFVSRRPSRRLRGWAATALVIVSHRFVPSLLCSLKTREYGPPFLSGPSVSAGSGARLPARKRRKRYSRLAPKSWRPRLVQSPVVQHEIHKMISLMGGALDPDRRRLRTSHATSSETSDDHFSAVLNATTRFGSLYSPCSILLMTFSRSACSSSVSRYATQVGRNDRARCKRSHRRWAPGPVLDQRYA
jgi:hypothetical protein